VLMNLPGECSGVIVQVCSGGQQICDWKRSSRLGECIGADVRTTARLLGYRASNRGLQMAGLCISSWSAEWGRMAWTNNRS
jgi:hypothetical protein